MSPTQVRFVSAGLFFLFIFLSGFWLRPFGKPYNTIIVTIHKLIGLAAGVFLVTTVYRVHQLSPLSPVEILAILVSVLLFAGNVATGSLLSTNKPMPAAISLTHKLTPYLIVLSTGVTLYLLLIVQ